MTCFDYLGLKLALAYLSAGEAQLYWWLEVFFTVSLRGGKAANQGTNIELPCAKINIKKKKSMNFISVTKQTPPTCFLTPTWSRPQRRRWLSQMWVRARKRQVAVRRAVSVGAVVVIVVVVEVVVVKPAAAACLQWPAAPKHLEQMHTSEFILNEDGSYFYITQIDFCGFLCELQCTTCETY